MSDLPQQKTIDQYQADGVTLAYVYSYLILLNSDITVYVTPSGQQADPVNDIQILGTDYTVSGMGVPTGGLVTFTVAPSLGDIVTLVRTIQISIDTDFSLAQNFNGANLDAAFKRVTLFTQQVATLLNTNALQYIVNTYLPNENSNFVPPLPNGYVWSGLNGAIVATNIETDADTSLLRSQLAAEFPLANGALLVGYYDTIGAAGVTVSKYLDYKDVYGNDTGVADALVLSIPTSNFNYVRGQSVSIVINQTNLTTTPTININGKGAKLIKRNPTSAAQAGDLTAGAVVGLRYDGTDFVITNLFIPTISSITPTVTILVSGSGNYNPPVGCTWIRVKGVGAGGGAGGIAATTFSGCGSGGGGGGYFEKIIVLPAPAYAYVVGTSGIGGLAGANNGTAGGDTTFGTLTGHGGGAGLGTSAGSTPSVLGGLGGLATGGDINIRGGYGFPSVTNLQAIGDGGNGGDSGMGGPTRIAGPNGNGANATDYGSGGAAATANAITNFAGGNGFNGKIIVEEFYN